MHDAYFERSVVLSEAEVPRSTSMEILALPECFSTPLEVRLVTLQKSSISENEIRILNEKRMKVIIRFSVLLSLVLFSWKCSFSLSGISIDPNIDTFNVETFENTAILVEPTLALDLTEALKDRIRNSSRLDWNKDKPDIIFTGTITGYRISSEAPQAGATTAFNQLTVNLRVEYEEVNNEDKSWKKTFSRFVQFPSNQDFNSVKDELIEEVSEYIVQDVFNEAFAKNW